MCIGCGGGGDNWLREELKALRDGVTETKVTLARNTESLEIHVKRTDLAEEAIRTLRSEMKPLAQHVAIEAAVARWVFSGGLIGVGTLFAKLVGLW